MKAASANEEHKRVEGSLRKEIGSLKVKAASLEHDLSFKKEALGTVYAPTHTTL
jgi:hypothetical protein